MKKDDEKYTLEYILEQSDKNHVQYYKNSSIDYTGIYSHSKAMSVICKELIEIKAKNEKNAIARTDFMRVDEAG